MFLGGILCYTLFGAMHAQLVWVLLVSTYLLYAILVVFNRLNRRFNQQVLISILVFLQLVLLGYLSMYYKDYRNDSKHLSFYEEEIVGYIGVILDIDEKKQNSKANKLKILAIINSENEFLKATGDLLLYHTHKDTLQPGTIIYVSGSPELILPPSNPSEFDYFTYMNRQQITHRHFARENVRIIGYQAIQPISDYFVKIRASRLAYIQSRFEDGAASQVGGALLLGQKKKLDKEVGDAYASAGAMHVLAVSGLHVGIIYGFFFLFFKPYKMKLAWRIIYLSIIILIIWSYALVTGMSPSVMRSATMFTLMALAQMKSRNPSIFNAVALSALILLVYDPFLIFAVGFQLSYLALLGILIIHPILVKLWIPKHRIVEYIWQISMVGFAAQIATFPLSAYYFHLFPNYFLVTNLIAIPGAFLIMAIGIPMLLFADVPFLKDVLVYFSELLIFAVNSMIFKIQDLPFAKSEIYVSECFMFIYWIVLTLMLMITLKPKKWKLYGVMFFLGLIGVINFISAFKAKPIEVLIYDIRSSGYAMDFGDSYYFDYNVGIDELSFKVFPHRDQHMKNRQALSAFVKGDSLKVFLPSGLGSISFENGHVNSIDSKMQEKFLWVEGNWEPVIRLDKEQPGAVRYVFK